MSNEEIISAILISIAIVVLVVFFCVLLIKLYIKKIKEHNIKELAFQKTLTTTIIETQEQVLENISKDLHDDTGQQLTVINFQLENLKLDRPERQADLAPLSDSIRKLSDSIRGISHSLNNQLIMQQDLLKAIATEMERLQKNTKIAISFVLQPTSKRAFSSEEKIIIYRIFQESLNNAMKHARATSISLTVQLQPCFEMVISDNGQGFDTQAIQQKRSLGLTNLKARAESIQYSVTIKSSPGNGTIITLLDTKTT
ncbi:sensor histidine kinase [Flavobacterium sp.]|jgi:signal transduction histidine kinase|uniref:sensor histidine kinase n=1 Tax=Flavobacterium sp. TaxID=239 RepID=UPI0037BFF6FD